MSNTLKNVGGSIVDILVGIGNIFGIGSVSEKIIKRAINKGQDLSETDAIKALKQAISVAYNLSSSKVDKLEAFLNNIPFLTTPTIKHMISDVRSKVTNQIQQAKINKAKVDYNIDRANRLVNEAEELSLGDIIKGKKDEYLNKANQALKEAADMNNNIKENINYAQIENKL